MVFMEAADEKSAAFLVLRFTNTHHQDKGQPMLSPMDRAKIAQKEGLKWRK
jgi:hypothetical protein